MGRVFIPFTITIEDDSGQKITLTVNTLAEAEEMLGRILPTDLVWQRYLQADTDVSNIPDWATMTAAEVVNYIDTNVTDLASAKTVMKAMGRVLVAQRNKLWPHLEGG